MGNPRNIDHLMSDDENKRYQAYLNAPRTFEDVFGSEESQVTIEGKYQHVINYDKLMDRIMKMHF